MIVQKVRDIMNDQIKHELESYYLYLSITAYFHSQNLDGMAHWMRCQAHEEMIHAMKFFGEDKQGLISLDRELGARVFPPGSPFDPAAHQAAG